MLTCFYVSATLAKWGIVFGLSVSLSINTLFDTIFLYLLEAFRCNLPQILIMSPGSIEMVVGVRGDMSGSSVHSVFHNVVNPLIANPVKALHFAILVWPTIFNFWHSGALALRTERQSARMSKIKNGGLDQYGTEPFERQQFENLALKGLTWCILH